MLALSVTLASAQLSGPTPNFILPEKYLQWNNCQVLSYVNSIAHLMVLVEVAIV